MISQTSRWVPRTWTGQRLLLIKYQVQWAKIQAVHRKKQWRRIILLVKKWQLLTIRRMPIKVQVFLVQVYQAQVYSVRNQIMTQMLIKKRQMIKETSNIMTNLIKKEACSRCEITFLITKTTHDHKVTRCMCIFRIWNWIFANDEWIVSIKITVGVKIIWMKR